MSALPHSGTAQAKALHLRTVVHFCSHQLVRFCSHPDKLGKFFLLSSTPTVISCSSVKGSATAMTSRICVCCGESIPEKGNVLSRNPNVCASCSSLMDGMEESDAQVAPEDSEPQKLATEVSQQSAPAVALQ